MADAVDAVHVLLGDLSQPLARSLGLSKLPEHAHVLVVSALSFWIIHIIIAPTLSKVLFPGSYGRLKTPRDRNNWNIRIVSLLHAFIVIPLSFRNLNLPALDADRAFGWDPKEGTLVSIACGYFLWDILESVIHFTDIGFVIHVSKKPFIAFYGPRFLLWELSTPFLNIHWFLDKLGLTGSTIQFVNGFFLLSTFASTRLVFGSFQSYNFFKTLFAIKDEAPFAVLLVFGMGNVVLSGLNVIWFTKMIAALQKRRKPAQKIGNVANGKKAD
ncbi:hypothetical protein EW145_g1041 [Phellinidium pouzarii]|uniref:TLC domain-containing protein n=1 Tax=Phellinidium pouzarii TaxID=167371 RepID=A0A4S4LGI2_9AGAM|nr:hypothetical protein EW145_g1041 [Phellinidium pouzarii]